MDSARVSACMDWYLVGAFAGTNIVSAVI